ncbi:MAG: hypothetical protein R2911_29485 [Caldilineaceae bacterium]
MLWVMKGFIDTVPIELEEAAFWTPRAFRRSRALSFRWRCPAWGGVDPGLQWGVG